MSHEHNLVTRDDFTRPDNNLRQVERRCVCGLAERRQYDGGETVSVRYRYDSWGGGWVDAAEILKLTFPVKLCESCGGSDVGCEVCGGMLVVEESGDPLGPPPKPMRRRR